MKKLLTSVLALGLLGGHPAARAQNLLANPGFEAGNTGFSTGAGYTFVPRPSPTATNYDPGAGSYTVGPSTQAYNTNFQFDYQDHTSGSGNMLIVNASTVADTPAWEQTVSGLTPGQSFTFSFWLLNNYFAGPASIQVSASGTGAGAGFVDVGAPFSNTSGTTTGTRASWQQQSLTLTVGAGGTLVIRLRDLTLASDGDDFSLDDIALVALGTVGTSTLAGTVFEDVNYGGGAGRSLATASSSAAASGFTAALTRPGATVELYLSTGTYVTSTTTDGSGAYSFRNLAAGTYGVRVVNATVSSARPGGSTVGLLPINTLDGGVTNRVGGLSPGLADAPSNAGGQSLNSLVTASQAPSTVAPVAVGDGASVTGIDFGFNFDLIVNPNNAGQGSLRQFILNANALGGETTLAQRGTYLNQIVGANPTAPDLPAGVETSIFMVPNGTVRPGLRAFDGTLNGGPASLLTGATSTSQVVALAPATSLPAITGPATALNGWTQSYNVGNTNSATLGTGGTTGVNGTAPLAQLNAPEVQLAGSGSVAVGLDLAASALSGQVLGLAVYGFGSGGDSNGSANLRIAASQVSVLGNVLGTSATSFAQPTPVSNADGIQVTGGTGLTVTNNLIGYHSGKGITTASGVTNVLVNQNELRSNGLGNSAWGGIDVQGSATTVNDNLFVDNAGGGLDSFASVGGNTFAGNTSTGNGRGTSTNAPGETAGVRVFGANNTISQNLIYNNYGAGVLVPDDATSAIISQNEIYGNGSVAANNGAGASGQLGIDLNATGNNSSQGTSPYVTLNNSAATGANSLINYPILQSARITGPSLVVEGLVAAGVTVEVFLAAPNAVANPSAGNNFGQGSSYLGSGVISSSGITGSYGPGNVNGFPQGTGINVNSFTLSIPLNTLTAAQRAALTANGARLTSTATLSGTGTSEFSGNIAIVTGPAAFNTTNLNVGAYVLGATPPAPVALNPGLTVPQAATDPLNSITSFTVFPVTSGTLFYNGVAVAGSGTLVPVANTGLLTYQPALGFTGTATFTFFATTTAGATSNTATYAIPVVISNRFVANDDGLDAPAGTPTLGNVVLNDTNPDNTTNFTATPVTGNPVTTNPNGSFTFATAHGSVTLSPDGTYTYTPVNGYLGLDSYQYQICQVGSVPPCSNVATVAINVYDPHLVCIVATGPNLLRNPGFEQGNTIFSSAYNYVAAPFVANNYSSGLYPENTYAVGTDAGAYHPNFTGLPRRGQKFMMVNGAASQSQVYAQSVTVVPNRYYTFSGYAASINENSPAVLGFVINGKSASASTALPTTRGQYVKFSGVWYSGTGSSATFEVRDINRVPNGNDFGLDDLYFGTCSVNLLAVDITYSPAIPAQSPAVSIPSLDATLTGTGVTIASFTIQTLPTSGTLRLGGPTGPVVTEGQVIAYGDRGALYYTPAVGFAGNAVFTYSATDSDGAGSNNIADYTIPVSSSPLPVQLTAFTARASGSSAQLDWMTASELNSKYFSIERSLSGQPDSFVAIGQVAGQGGKLTTTSYRFFDRTAAASGSLLYYRLRQVDLNGAVHYSAVRTVSFATVGLGGLSLYPNPTAADGSTSLDLSSLPATASYQVRLLDATGRTARQWTLAGGQLQPLQLADLAAGHYLLVVSGTQPDGSPARQVLRLTKE